MAREVLELEGDSGLWPSGIWDELLAYIEEQRVIPIIGPDLIRLNVDGASTCFQKYVAIQLAEKLGVPTDDLSEHGTLNDVVCQFLRRNRDRRGTPYVRLFEILRESKLQPPPALIQLARIRHFNLFVSATFDTLLENALAQLDACCEPKILAYAPNKVVDLPCPKDNLQQPTIFHLLGRVSASPSYVICDEDMLEFVSALQSDTRRPERLFDELHNNHLLLLGVDLSDWLARFFLRAAKRRRLSDTRDVLEVLADTRMHQDTGLVVFLQHFSSRTKIYKGGAVEFVEELSQRWQERHPEGVCPSNPDPLQSPQVFLSYAHEDRPAVDNLRRGLEAEGLVVWFDSSELASGDVYDERIRKHIRACKVFVAVLSQNTEKPHPRRYFRSEWRHALGVAREARFQTSFIVPVVVDTTDQFEEIPDQFRELHQDRLLGGRPTAEFVARIKRLCTDPYRGVHQSSP